MTRSSRPSHLSGRAWAILMFVVLVVAGVVIAVLQDTTPAVDSHRLGIGIGLVVLAIPFFIWKHLVVGKDERLSTSKTIAAVWTYLIASVLLGFVIAKLMNHPQALDSMKSGLTGQYALLIGGPIGAAILAKLIVVDQVTKDTGTKSTADGAKPADLVTNDAGEGDLGDLQYVLFNVVTMVFVFGTLIKSPTLGLPHIPDVLLGLTSVSAVGFVGKKALPAAPTTATMQPVTGPAGTTTVTISGKGLLVGADPTAAEVTVLFGSIALTPTAKSRTSGVDTIAVTVPPGLPAGQEVPVVVVTSAPAAISAGSFRVS
jgi:hypothetical protein